MLSSWILMDDVDSAESIYIVHLSAKQYIQIHHTGTGVIDAPHSTGVVLFMVRWYTGWCA
jgi:hypothetical protein